MFDKLDDMLIHYEELMHTLGEPDVAQDTKRFTKLMKEQAELAPIVEAYREYKKAKQSIEDSLQLLEEENDEEMRELAKEELSESKKKVEELEHELKVLLLPKDPNDDKNIILKSGQALTATRRLSSRRSCTACTAATRTASTGRWR